MLQIGENHGDYTITGVCKRDNDTRNYYKMKCLVCGREKDKPRKDILKGVGTSHQSCSSLLSPDEKFYVRYMSMRTRTTNKNTKGWADYKNISSDYYKYYVDFYDDMYESYLLHVDKYGYSDTTLDRIDPCGDYRAGNIRWATRTVQNNNTRKHMKKYTAHNIITNEIKEFSNQTEFAEYSGLSKQSVNSLVKGRRSVIKNLEIKQAS